MIDPSHQPGTRRSLQLSGWLAGALLLLLLIGVPRDIAGFQHFHALHSLLEILAIAISAMVFAVGWHAHEPDQRATMLPFACLMLGVAILDTSHLLSYQGTPDFLTPNSGEKSIDFWLAARLLSVLALLLLAFRGYPPLARLSRGLQLGSVLVAVLLLHLVFLFRPEWTPSTFVPGQGLTPYKQAFEAVLIAGLLVAAWRFHAQLDQPQRPGAVPPGPLLGAALVLCLSGICFMYYVDLTGFYNTLGHVYKVVGYVLLYRAVFVARVELPFERLRESEAELRALLSAIPDPLFEVDAEGHYLRVHAVDRSILVAPPEALLGRTGAEVMPPEAWAVCRAAMDEAAREGIARGLQARLQLPDGERWFEMSVSALRDRAGRATRFVAISRDVTEAHAAARRLKLQAGRAEALLSLTAAAERLDERGFLRYGIEQAEALTGSRIAFIHFVNNDQETLELVTWSSDTLAHDCTAAYDSHYPISAAGIWADAFRQRRPVLHNDYASAPNRRGLPEGHAEVIRLISVPVLDGSAVRMMAGVGNRETPYGAEDVETVQLIADAVWRIARQQRAETELRKLSAAVEQDPKPVLITSLDGSIEYVNPAFSTVTGYPLAEVYGRNPRVLQSGRTPQAVYTAMWERLAAGEVWRGELINRRRDGREYAADTQIYPVRDREGHISHYLAHSEDISERKATAERIVQLSNYDQLTGLANPMLLRERARLALESARRLGQTLAVIHIDLDHTKAVNDSLGHTQGDLLLMEIAGRLARIAGEGDTVGRISGDEFAFIAPDAGQARAGQLGFRLVNAIAEPLQLAGQELVVTASIGIAMYPQDGENFETLAKNADVAMRRLKQDARNGYRFFTAEQTDRSERLLGLSSALHQAMVRQQLRVVYQPQIELDHGSAVAVEALLRWQHPRWGEVSPAEFIPIAEATGLIVPIGRWVLEVALEQLSRWQREGLHQVVIAVNVSAVQFRDPQFLDTIEELLVRSQVDPTGLELELTEAVAMRDPAAAVAIIDQLHQRGVRMSIDDFGTGYSSLSQLKRFRISKLKIDQSFIRELPTDPDDQAIVTAIIQMAHSLGVRTLAEGVETAAQLAFLHAQGCDGVQGHFYSRPLEAAAAERYLREHRHTLP
ncbi:MAG: EAL domain-containing protein [Xanthomonadales bacterium]|jgi:diguanylate cyclase (GGDEF)-like protein/PAS domain S-box-containing protein|nr:EAL domain-containing protein [Xanthomonadales bacterium]